MIKVANPIMKSMSNPLNASRERSLLDCCSIVILISLKLAIISEQYHKMGYYSGTLIFNKIVTILYSGDVQRVACVVA